MRLLCIVSLGCEFPLGLILMLGLFKRHLLLLIIQILFRAISTELTLMRDVVLVPSFGLWFVILLQLMSLDRLKVLVIS